MRNLLFVLSCCVVLAGCGGGGSGAALAPPTIPGLSGGAVNTPPTGSGPVSPFSSTALFATRIAQGPILKTDRLDGATGVIRNATVSIETGQPDSVAPPVVSIKEVASTVEYRLIPVAVDGTTFAHYFFRQGEVMRASTEHKLVIDGLDSVRFTTGTSTSRHPVEQSALVDAGMVRCTPLGSQDNPVEYSTLFGPIVQTTGPFAGVDNLAVIGPGRPDPDQADRLFQASSIAFPTPNLALGISPLRTQTVFEVRYLKGSEVVASGWVRTNAAQG